VYVVMPDPQVDPQRAEDLRLVVYDQHGRHGAAVAGDRGAGRGAAGRDRVMVRPPPGAPSGSRVPPMASVRPRDRARPRPTPVVLSVSPSRWNGTNMRVQSAAGMPGPRSMTRSSTRSSRALAVSRGGLPGGE